MIERTIDWCNANRFLVFIAVAALVVGGIWSLNLIPLDALPDISDVQVIIHTEWMGQPPNIIEDQVTYPIVTTMPAAPHVKAVRAQTMFNDSYVFVVFEDGTDIYWARSRVLKYMQQLEASYRPECIQCLDPMPWEPDGFMSIDRNRLLALHIPLQTVIENIRANNNESRRGGCSVRSPIPRPSLSRSLRFWRSRLCRFSWSC